MAIFTIINFFLGLGLGGIASLKSMEHESRAATWRKMRDYHMKRYLNGERLFVG
jgi:hypothetical protein